MQWGRRAWHVVRRRMRWGSHDPAAGYDLWSATYDAETDNLLVVLDESLFQELLSRVAVERKCVVDVGCGTGRHWGKILAREPADLVGYDASPGMLEQLRQKYPQATVHLARKYRLWCTPADSCDLVVSTLALSHFASVRAAFDEWARVLRAGGDVLVTDLHPAVAARSRTTFRYQDQILSVKTYVRPLSSLRAAIARSGLEPVAFSEVPMDDALLSRCERADMRTVFETMKGLPFLYGMHLRKPLRPHGSTPARERRSATDRA